MAEATPTLPTERGPDRNSAMARMREEDDQSLKEWFDGMGGDTSLKIQIVRKKPMVSRTGDNIAGILETVEDRVDEDYVRDQWGGGTFQLKAFKQNNAGSWVYVRARSITIAGAPKMNGVPCGEVVMPAAVAAPGDEIAERAMSTMERVTQRAEQRMERLEQESRKSGGTDIAALEAVLRPIRDQLEEARTEARELRQQLYAASTKAPPKDEFRDKVLEKMIDGENARVESLRSQYEARIDRMRDNHEDQVKRLEDRHQDDLKRLEKQQDRSIEQAQKSADDRIAAQKLGYDARIDALKSEIGKLERENAAAQTRIAQLEARKDQTIGEKAEELVKVREALDGIGKGGDGDDADKPWYERLIDAAGNSEALLALVNKVGGAAGATGQGNPQGQPVQQQLPPPGVPFRTADGQVWMVGPDGQPRPINPAQLQQRARLAAARKKKRDQAAAATPPAEGAAPAAEAGADGGGEAGDVIDEALEGTGDPGRPPEAAEVKIAITFMENAAQNGTDPKQFASSMRSLVPQDILRFVHRVGVDQFLNSVVEPGSVLTTQRGRNFVRSAFKALMEG